MSRLLSIVFEDTLPTIEWRTKLALAGIVSGAVLLKIVWKAVATIRREADNVRGFPGPKPHWLLGNLDKFTKDETGLNMLDSWARLYGDVFVLWFGATTPILVATHPDTNRVILSANEPKNENFNKCLRPFIGDGLVVSQGKKWARNRRMLTKAFHFQVLQPYIEVFSESTNIMLSKWRQLNGGHATIELRGDISLMMLDSLTKCTFGTDINCQNTEDCHPYTTAVIDIVNLISERVRFLPYHSDLIYYFSISGYRFRRACRVAHDFSRNVVRQREQDRQNKEKDSQPRNKYVNFIDILLDAKDEDGKGLSREEIFDEVHTVMAAGHDTTSSGLCWFLYNLAKHPEYQEKCRQEVIGVLGSRNTMTWEDVAKLQYTSQCLKESLRLNPPISSASRHTTHDITFADGRTAPAGTNITVHINATHYNPELWPNPEVYDPERFAPDNVQGRSPFSYIPFSAGYRNCIGQQFAMNEMKTAAALILKNFELTPDVTRPAVRKPAIVLRSESGFWIHLRPLQT